MISLDIGSGPKKEFDINIDLNPSFRPTIVCDAQHLPLKPKIFDIINCSHCLEHLDKPHLCLTEINRVANARAKILMGFPLEKNASNAKCYLRVLLFNLFMPSFPFAVYEIIKGLEKIRNKSYIVYHKWILTPDYISRFLQIQKVEKRGSYWQSLFVGRKAKILGNLIQPLKKMSPIHSYLITCSPQRNHKEKR